MCAGAPFCEVQHHLPAVWPGCRFRTAAVLRRGVRGSRMCDRRPPPYLWNCGTRAATCGLAAGDPDGANTPFSLSNLRTDLAELHHGRAVTRAPYLALALAHPPHLAHNLWAPHLLPLRRPVRPPGRAPAAPGRPVPAAPGTPGLRPTSTIKPGSSSSATFMDLFLLDDRNTTHNPTGCLLRPLQILGFADGRFL